MIFVITPIMVYCCRRLFIKPARVIQKNIVISRMLIFSGFLLCAIWCIRFAVGYYAIATWSPSSKELPLTYLEEVFNSINHSFQTFSMDEDYTEYIKNGKAMFYDLFGDDTVWATVYGVYASLLGFIAPVIGGAIIFEILARIFPKLKLFFSYLAVWREKYYFSELNEASLALAKSVCNLCKSAFQKPVIIFLIPTSTMRMKLVLNCC
jgi:hypothetical protein